MALLALAGYAVYIWTVAPAVAGVPGRAPWASPGGSLGREASLFAAALALMPGALALTLAGGGAYSMDALRARRRTTRAAARPRLSRLAVGLIVLNLAGRLIEERVDLRGPGRGRGEALGVEVQVQADHLMVSPMLNQPPHVLHAATHLVSPTRGHGGAISPRPARR